jgi:hypothetical protein
VNRRLISFLFAALWLAATALFFSIVLGINAEEASNLQKNLFFILGTFVITGLVYPLVIVINKATGYVVTTPQSILRPLRQSVLFALVCTFCAYLGSLQLFRIADGITIALAALLLEFFFQANQSHVTRSKSL